MSGLQNEEQQRNLAKAGELVELYESQGPQAFLDHYDEYYHPDFVFRPAIAELGEKTYRGREGLHDWVSDMETIATDYTLSEIELRAVGEHQLLVLGTMHLVGRESGAAFESEYAWCYRMEEGLVVSGRAFLSYAEAERAAEDAERQTAEGEGESR